MCVDQEVYLVLCVAGCCASGVIAYTAHDTWEEFRVATGRGRWVIFAAVVLLALFAVTLGAAGVMGILTVIGGG